MSEENERRPRRKERPSFIWPVILITVGVVFLLSNLGIFGDDVWANVWNLWPVIFIAIGLDSLFRRNEIAGPVFMIGLGIVFLLSSVGILGWGAWDVLWRLWPLLLVAIGLEIMIGRRSLWLSALTVVVIVAILGGVMWVYGARPASGDRLTTEAVNQSFSDITQAEISISPAVGDLNVDALVDSTALVSGEISMDSNRRVYTDYRVSGSTGYFSVDSRSIVNFPGNRSWDWDLGLTSQLPLEVDLSMGAGDLNADLSGLSLTGLSVSQGLGELSVVLAPEGEYRAEVSQAIGSIVVEIPESAGLRIEVSRAISNLDLPPGFERRNDFYYSPNYDSAEIKIDLEVNQAIGDIDIRYGE